MTFDRHDWKEHCEAFASAKNNKPSAAILSQAAVRAENLTGDPNWDIFISYLTYELEAASRERAQVRALWDDPRAIDYGQLMAAKIVNIRLTERITLLEAVLSLPSDIIKNGKKATDLLHTSLPKIAE